jgi:hypothetical protein
MLNRIRLLTLLLIAAFVVGTSLQTVNAAVMDVGMPMAELAIDNCQDCSGSGDSMPDCDIACPQVSTIAIAPVQVAIPALASVAHFGPTGSLTSRSNSPDPFPPRTNILN